jgi:sec-independent protein translocase protein TatA
MFGFDNPIHILFILVLLLLVFGAKRLPEMGRSLGTGLRGFKESISGEHDPIADLKATPSVPPMMVTTADQPPLSAEPTPGHTDQLDADQLVTARAFTPVATSEPVVTAEPVLAVEPVAKRVPVWRV